MMDDQNRIDWRTLGFGASILDTSEDKRTLSLVEVSTLDEAGELSYSFKAGRGEGRIGRDAIEMVRTERFTCLLRFQEEEYRICKCRDTLIRLTYKENRHIDFLLPNDVGARFVRKAQVFDLRNRPFELDISGNHTPVFFLRGVLSLITLGIIRPPRRRSIIPPLFEADAEMERALVLGTVAIQMIYCPFDYEDWS